MRKIFLPVLAAFAFTSPVQAWADEPSTVVSYADLDLDDPADVATLEHRIVIAAKKVCARSWDVPLSLWADTEACRADAFRTAMAKLKTQLSPETGESVALAD